MKSRTITLPSLQDKSNNYLAAYIDAEYANPFIELAEVGKMCIETRQFDVAAKCYIELAKYLAPQLKAVEYRAEIEHSGSVSTPVQAPLLSKNEWLTAHGLGEK